MMFKVLLACVALLAVVAAAPADITAGTELVLTFLVHRHGDRTPTESSVVFSNDVPDVVAISETYGYGQLTSVGKRRAYQLGESIKQRYNDFIAPQYNHSEIFIRSTDSTRTKMTVLSALAAIFPAYDNVFEGMNWTPVPYTTVPPLYDFDLAYANCPIFIDSYTYLNTAPSESMVENYRDVLTLLSEHAGVDLLTTPGLAYGVYDEYTAQISLGIPVDPEIEDAWSDVEAVAGAAIDFVFGNKTLIPYQAGVLLNEFYNAVSEITSGTSSQRVRIYSAHDFNVFSFESVTKVTNKQGVPKYASAYALELRKVVETGKYVVVPVYLPSPGEDFIYLDIEGCGSVCDYDQFVAITSENALDEDTWRSKCGWYESMVIDDSSFA